MKTHICRFNDPPQVCECYAAGMKDTKIEVMKNLRDRMPKLETAKQGTSYEFAQQALIGWNSAVLKMHDAFNKEAMNQ